MNKSIVAVAVLAFLARAAGQGQEAGRTTEERRAGVERRGDHVMGFDHAKTAHHFRLTATGGAIEADADNAADVETRDQIRTHLHHIAQMFTGGNFEAPMLIHDRIPPGVPVMKRLRSKIDYRFEPTKRGGRILISTPSARARRAIHEFLRFQIRDHQTGDPLEPSAGALAERTAAERVQDRSRTPARPPER